MTPDGHDRDVVLALLGAPGAGKGTLAALLAAGGLTVVSTGALVRDRVARGGPDADRLATYLADGRLVPDDAVLALMGQPLRGPGAVVLDGFPRSLGQARALDGLVAEAGRREVRAVHLDVPAAVARERLAGRLVCRGCGRVYHRTLVPPRAAGRCDSCSSTLTVRGDDTARATRRRLAEFGPAIAPVLDHYRTRGALLTVDGMPPPAQVHGAVVARLRAAGG